jgi:HEAT repeat protein
MDKELRANEIVYGLSNPIMCYKVQLELISLGKAAVKPIISFLLSGPTNEHEPRCLAAETLGLIGGEDVLNGLVIALLMPLDVPDPIKSLAEEAVRNCICHALERLGDKKAIEPLLIALEAYHLIGAAEALAEFREQRAISILVGMLDDSFKRRRVSDAILNFGIDAIEDLVKTTDLKGLREDVEILPSIERRAEAAKLLGLIRDKSVIPWLLCMIDDEKELVRFEASLSLISLMERDAPNRALQIVISSLHKMNFERRFRAEEALCLMNPREDLFQ